MVFYVMDLCPLQGVFPEFALLYVHWRKPPSDPHCTTLLGRKQPKGWMGGLRTETSNNPFFCLRQISKQVTFFRSYAKINL